MNSYTVRVHTTSESLTMLFYNSNNILYQFTTNYNEFLEKFISNFQMEDKVYELNGNFLIEVNNRVISFIYYTSTYNNIFNIQMNNNFLDCIDDLQRLYIKEYIK